MPVNGRQAALSNHCFTWVRWRPSEQRQGGLCRELQDYYHRKVKEGKNKIRTADAARPKRGRFGDPIAISLSIGCTRW